MSDGTSVRLRVTVTDTWDTVTIAAPADMTMGKLKEEALRRALGRPGEPTAYAIKYRGAALFDDNARVLDLAIPDGAPLVVLPRRRHPVR